MSEMILKGRLGICYVYVDNGTYLYFLPYFFNPRILNGFYLVYVKEISRGTLILLYILLYSNLHMMMCDMRNTGLWAKIMFTFCIVCRMWWLPIEYKCVLMNDIPYTLFWVPRIQTKESLWHFIFLNVFNIVCWYFFLFC